MSSETQTSGSTTVVNVSAKTTTSDAQLPTPIPVVTIDNRSVNELSEEERAVLVKNAELGVGIIVTEGAAPKSSMLSVIAPVKPTDIITGSTQEARDDVLVSYTETASANAAAGWARVSVSGETPFVKGGLKAHFKESASASESASTAYVHGAHQVMQCTAKLPLAVKPNPAFEKAVQAALGLKEELRANALMEVFNVWGHVFVKAVEMGGKKTMSTSKTLAQGDTKSSIEADMKLAISNRVAKGSAGGGASSEKSSSFAKKLETMSFATVGGDVEETDIKKWKDSVKGYRNWRVTERLELCSVISLFNPKMQEDILSTQPTILYRLWHEGLKEHHFVVSKDSVIRQVTRWGYKFEENAANICTSQLPGTAPFHRLRNPSNGRHFCTLLENERIGLLSKGWTYEKVLGYVWIMPMPGSVPLYRMDRYGDSDADHWYSIYPWDEQNATKYFGYKSQGVVGYVLPPSP